MDILIINRADSIKNIEEMTTDDLFFYGSIWKTELDKVNTEIEKIEKENGK